MYGAFLACTLLLSKRTMVETCVGIAEQLFTVGTRIVFFLFPAIEADHQLYRFLSCAMRDAFISFFFTLWNDKDSEDYAEMQAYSVKIHLLLFSILKSTLSFW